jgi:methyl-accepting chemotaxis protein
LYLVPQKIVDGVNKTLDLVITPVNETVAVLKRLAEGDLTLRMTGEYKGDFDILKTALNDSLESFNDTLGQVNTAVDQVAEGSLQVSQASQSLSQGATEQASSLEEITSSITEIASQTKLNTESAGTVNNLAKTAKSNAENGNTQMQNLVVAMGDINKSAEEIKKIVKAIDDISFQINLLALNANVEAARAGKYGKGFAVVAEEVRNLAVRSANSVKDTTRMVDDTIANIERGNTLCDLTAKQLADIVGGAAQVATLAEEVATASKEQTLGLEQVSTGLNQIDQVTQANTASSEESASASEELSSQSQQVKNMLARFKLRAKEGKLNNTEMMQMLRSEMSKQGGGFRAGAPAGAPKALPVPSRKGKSTAINPADVISLDDDNFGKF